VHLLNLILAYHKYFRTLADLSSIITTLLNLVLLHVIIQVCEFKLNNVLSDLPTLCHTGNYIGIHILVACEAENDTTWNIEWPATPVGENASQKWPGLSESIGM